MSDLVRTLLICGLLSGTQPITIMGLMLVSTGEQSVRKGVAYLSGNFVVESVILLTATVLVGGVVERASGMGRLFLVLRVLLGIALLVVGFRLRREPSGPVPPVPKALERVQNLSPGKAFLAGMLLADYQGPLVGSLALTAADVTFGGRMLALAFYSLLATGIPLAIFIAVIRSRRTRERVDGATNWVMVHRRQLGSWFALVLGLLLVGDALLGFLV